MSSTEKNKNLPSIPDDDVLRAFDIRQRLTLLKGGQGTSYRAGDTVFKPVDDEQESVWRAELLSSITESNFRVSRPLKTNSGAWTYRGWQASRYVEGKETRGRWREKISVSRQFHKSLEVFTKPGFLGKASHPWAVADRMVWGEQELVFGKSLKLVMPRLQALMQPVRLESQLIHGDMTGNILFHQTLPPAIIDFSPYWRPAEYATAIIIVDSIVWEHAPERLLQELPSTPEYNQLLLRATMWRIKTNEEFVTQYAHGSLDDVAAYERMISLLEKKLQ